MKTPFTVFYDTRSGIDYDESFPDLRSAMRYYNDLSPSVPFKSLVYYSVPLGSVTLLTSKGTNNLHHYGFLPCDYN